MTAKGIPTRPAAKRLNKLPVIIVSTVVFAVVIVCFYVVTERQKRLQKAAGSGNVINSQPINNNTPSPEFLTENYAKTLEDMARSEKKLPEETAAGKPQTTGASVQTPDNEPQGLEKAAVNEPLQPDLQQAKKSPPQFYREPGPQIEPKKSDAELFREKVASQKREMAFKAQMAPTGVPIMGTSSSQQPSSSLGPLPGIPQYQQPSMMVNQQEEKDQALKQGFLDTATEDAVTLTNAYHEAVSPFELKQGHLIPMTLITKINSDLPGRIKAQVTENVYDTATGNYLLVPQGTMVNGIYDSRVVFGQKRVLIAWQRLIFPDGSSLNVGSMPGTDQEGTAGLKDLVDNHYFQIFGAAILMSVVNAGFTMATDTKNDENNVETTQDALAKSAAQQMQQTFARLIDKIMNIQPELIIRQGKQGHIILTKDVLGLKPYNPAQKPTYFLKTADIN